MGPIGRLRSGFYGWRMVIAGTGLQFLQASLMMQAFGAYVAVLSAERGWSKTALSGAAALQSVETAVVGPVIGWLIDRVGEHRLIRIGVVIFGAGLITLGLIDSLAGFYGAVILIALGSSLAGYFPINVAIIHWFERRRARALSTVSLGLALGGIATPLVAGSIMTFGWRATAIGSGVLAIAIGIPLSMVFRGRPATMGQYVDGVAPEPPAAEPTVTQAATSGEVTGSTTARVLPPLDGGAPEFTARQALRTSAFWLLSIGHGVALLVVTGVNVHAITHISEGLGYTVQQAALVITLMTVAQIGGVLIGMTVGDRYDKRRLAAASMLGHGFGLLMLTWSTNVAMLLGFAVLHGTAWGLRGPLMQAIRADYFGRRSIGMIIGLSSAIIAVGQVGGPMIAGAMADLTGNYRAGYTLLAVLALAGSIAFLAARPPRLAAATGSAPF